MKLKFITFLAVILSIPQIAFSQYTAKCFCIDDYDGMDSIVLNASLSSTDTILRVNISHSVSGFFVSGNVRLNNSFDSYVRVLLQDLNGFEYLVYEVYPMLADSSSVRFSKTALETAFLNNEYAKCIKIEAHDASVFLEKAYVTHHSNAANRYFSMAENNLEAQCEYVAHKLNENLSRRGKTWLAGTTSVSQMTFEEKKDLFGGKVPMLYGFDYYKDGVFVMPEYERELANGHLRTSSPFVPEWDGRNRHGQNWLPPIRSQRSCGSCWAFSAVGTFESYINRYYNQHINYDLSEQELVSCSNAGNCSGGSNHSALVYIKNSGVVPEDCFVYTATNNTCSNKCSNPSDIVSFSQLSSFGYNPNEDSIKKALFKAPISFAIDSWSHAIVLVGYKEIQAGEHYYAQSPYSQPEIEDDDPLVGHPAWLIRNSWGSTWGNGGYGYVALPLSETHGIYKITGSVSSQIYDDGDIVCEDSDGDGYYNWGVGPKPSSCPPWIPDEEDGDDSDYSKGPIDEYGFLQDIIPSNMDTIYIDTDTEYAVVDFVTNRHILVRNNSTLTISNQLTCYQGISVTVESGSTLAVSGGALKNVILKLRPGSTLLLSNCGSIIHNKVGDFKVPKGATFRQTSGVVR